MWTLIPASLVFALIVLLVFRRFSPQQRIRRARRLIAAHLYELRLFTDEPALVWKAQLGLLRYNFLNLGLALVPALVMAIPGFFVFVQLDALYGLRPLPVGKAAIVTAHLSDPFDLSSPPPTLRLPAGILQETAGIRIPEAQEICWRIRPLRATDGVLRIEWPHAGAEKRIQAGTGLHYLSERRVHAWWELPLYGNELPLHSSRVDWIEVGYPRNSIAWLGLDFSWIVWFLLFSGLAVLLLKRRFRVTL